MRIRVFVKPESIVKLLTIRGKNPAWLRIRIGVSPATFSKIMSGAQSPSGLVAKRIMKYMLWRGNKWEDIFKIEGD